MNGDVAPVADLLQALEDFVEIDSSRFPQPDVVQADRAPVPGTDRALSLGIEAVVLDVDVEEVRTQFLDGLPAVVFSRDHPVGGFVDDPEVGTVHLLQHLEGAFYRLEEAGAVGLVGQADAPLGGGVGGPLRPGNVLLLLHADPDQVGPEGLRQVQVWRDVAKTGGPQFVVAWHGEVSGDHGDGESGVPDPAAHVGHLLGRGMDARLGGPHAEGPIPVVSGQVNELSQVQRGFLLVGKALRNPGRQR